MSKFDLSSKKILIISSNNESFDISASEMIFSPNFRAAKIKLLESNHDSLVVLDLLESEKEQLLNFIEAIREHPSLSSIEIYINSSLIENLSSNSIQFLTTKEVAFIDEEDFIRSEDNSQSNTSLDSREKDEFSMLLSELTEISAKSLAKLKLDYLKSRKDKPLDRTELVDKYLKILKQEF